MPKTPKPNGFMVYTLEWKAKHGKHLSIQDATARAGVVWKDMSLAERTPYNERAKAQKLNTAAVGKLTCTGKPLSLVEKEKEEGLFRVQQMERETQLIVENSVKNDCLETQTYFFIMANYFTKSQQGNLYVPAELSVAEFSLKEGIISTYHTFLNPVVNIYGHQFEAEDHSRMTHGLPLPPNALGETNLGAVYNRVLDFIRDKKTNKYPPVYTLPAAMPIVSSTIEYLFADVGTANLHTIKVHALNYLLFVLKNATCEKGELELQKSIHITDAFLERDFYEYEPNIGCKFHEDSDKSRYCTLSHVVRWGYLFADLMCNDVAIRPVPGRHMPARINMNKDVKPINHFDDELASTAGSIQTCGSDAIIKENRYNPDQFLDTLQNSLNSSNSVMGRGRGRGNTMKHLEEFVDEPANPWTRVTSRRNQPKEEADETLTSQYGSDLSERTFRSNNSVHSNRGHGRGYF